MMRLLPILAAYHAHKSPGCVSQRLNATLTVQDLIEPTDIPHLLDQFARDVCPLGELGGEGLAHLLALGGALHTMRAWACRWGAELGGAAFRHPMGREIQGARLQDLEVVATTLVNRSAVSAGKVLGLHANTVLNALYVTEWLCGAQVLKVFHAGAGVKWWLATEYGEALGIRRDGQPTGLVCEVLSAGAGLVGE